MTGQNRPAEITFAKAIHRPGKFQLHADGNRYGAAFASPSEGDQGMAAALVTYFQKAGIEPVVTPHQNGGIGIIEIPEQHIDLALELARR